MTWQSREYLCGCAGTLNTKQIELECDARFPRHPKWHVSTGSAQSHYRTALLQQTAPLQPKHSHRVVAFTQNMTSTQRPCKHTETTLHNWSQTHHCRLGPSPGHGVDQTKPTNHPCPLRGHQPATTDIRAAALPRSLTAPGSSSSR